MALLVGHTHPDGEVRGEIVVDGAVNGLVPAAHIVDERVAVVVADHGTATQGAALVQRTAGVQLHAVAVPGAGLAGQADGGLLLAALAHEVQRPARAVAALQQRRRAAQHFGAVVETQVLGQVAAQGIGVARDRHAIVLDGVDAEAAGKDEQARAGRLGGGQAGGAVDQVGDGFGVLVIHLLAGHHRHRLRDVLQALHALAQGHRARGIGVAALGGGVERTGTDGGGAQVQSVGAGAGEDQHVALEVVADAAVPPQQPRQCLVDAHTALDRAAAQAFQVDGVVDHLGVALLAELLQRLAQWLRGDVEVDVGGPHLRRQRYQAGHT